MTKDDLKPGMWYLISAPTAGTLVIKQGDVQVPVAYQAGQTPFYALGNEVEYGAGAVINGPFAKAPTLGLGGGGGNITPEEQGALTNLIGGTVAANGITLTFKLTSDQKKLVTLTGLDELNTGGAPINTLNGNVYHGSGSANFTETIGGQVYQTSIDAHHVECRWNGALKVHLHADANGNAVLELNGERVVTNEYMLRRIEAQMTTNVDGFNNVLALAAHAIGKEEVYIQGRYLDAPRTLSFSDDVKRVFISCSALGAASQEDSRHVYSARNADVFVRETGVSRYSSACRLNPGMDCKSFTYYNALEFINEICNSDGPTAFAKDIPLTIILPLMKSTTFPERTFRRLNELRTVKVYAPAWAAADTPFFANGSIGSPLSKESVVYTLKNFGITDGTNKMLHIGIDKNLVSIDPDTHVTTLLDAEIQAAHDARVAKGWAIEYVPST